jgi:nitrogen fixation protein FixH
MPATSSSPERDQAEIDRRRGRFVPWVIAAFYMTFMSALIGFVVIAYQHPPGDVTAEAYEKGLAYNQTLAKGAAQDGLRWQSRIDTPPGRIVFTLTDDTGRPVGAGHVKAWFVRPSDAAKDHALDLSEGAPGVYAAAAPLAKGLWEVHVTAALQGGEYQAMTTLTVE